MSPDRPTVRLSVPVNDQWSHGLMPNQEPAAAQLLHTIRRRWISRRGDRTGTVPLKHSYLRKLIPEVVEVRSRLAQDGIIDVDEKFVPGRRSMGYRVRPEFRSTRMTEYQDAGLARRIARSRAEAERRLLPVHRWLRGKLTLPEFDLQRALAIIAEIDQVPKKRRKHVLTLDDYRLMLSEQSQAFYEELTFGNPKLKPDDHGRVHTSLSRLPGILRGCLSIGGEPLVGLDLKNSQPLFLGLVAAEFHSSRQARHRLLNYQPNVKNPYGRDRKGGGGEDAFSFTTMQRKLQTLAVKGVYGNRLNDISSLDKYMEVCQHGQLYESLSKPRQHRNSVKKKLLIDMYGDGSDPSAIQQRFEQAYPRVFDVMTALKEGDHRRLSWILQNREARIFIGRICVRLMLETPKLPVLTIHDSILTTPGHFNTVKSIALEEFARLGLRPKLKREVYA